MGFNSGSGSGGGSVAGSSDVALSNPANNNVLTYDTTTSKWKNAIAPAATVKPLVWNGSAYPTRTAGITNIFVGAQDPGLAMNATNDVWAAPTTTLDSVVAAAQDTSSDLNVAIGVAATPSRRFVPATVLSSVDNRPPNLSNFSTGTNTSSGAPAWVYPSGSVTIAGAVIETPPGWSRVRVRILWSHTNASSSGSVNWLARASSVTSGIDVNDGGSSTQVTTSAPATGIIAESLISNVATINSGGDLLKINIARLGSSDSFGSSAGLIGFWLERTA